MRRGQVRRVAGAPVFVWRHRDRGVEHRRTEQHERDHPPGVQPPTGRVQPAERLEAVDDVGTEQNERPDRDEPKGRAPDARAQHELRDGDDEQDVRGRVGGGDELARERRSRGARDRLHEREPEEQPRSDQDDQTIEDVAQHGPLAPSNEQHHRDGEGDVPAQVHEVGNRRKRRRGRENVVVHDQDRVPGEMETDAGGQPPQIGGALRPVNEDSTDAGDECEDSDPLVADGLRGRPRVGEEVQRDHQRRKSAGRNDRQPRSSERASSHVGS